MRDIKELFPTDDPVPAARMVGRREDVDEIAAQLQAGVSVVLAGARRTGKTSVAQAALEPRPRGRRLRRVGRPLPPPRRRRPGRGHRHRRARQPAGRAPAAAEDPRAGRRRARRGHALGQRQAHRRARRGGRDRPDPGARRRGPRPRPGRRARAARADRRGRRQAPRALPRRVPGPGQRGTPVRGSRPDHQADAGDLPALAARLVPLRRVDRAPHARPVRPQRPRALAVRLVPGAVADRPRRMGGGDRLAIPGARLDDRPRRARPAARPRRRASRARRC